MQKKCHNPATEKKKKKLVQNIKRTLNKR